MAWRVFGIKKWAAIPRFSVDKKGYVYTPWRAVYFEGGKRRSCILKIARSPPILTHIEVKK